MTDALLSSVAEQANFPPEGDADLTSHRQHYKDIDEFELAEEIVSDDGEEGQEKDKPDQRPPSDDSVPTQEPREGKRKRAIEDEEYKPDDAMDEDDDGQMAETPDGEDGGKPKKPKKPKKIIREVDDKEILQELAGKEDIYGGSDEDDPEVAEIVRKKMASAVFLPPRKRAKKSESGADVMTFDEGLHAAYSDGVDMDNGYSYGGGGGGGSKPKKKRPPAKKPKPVNHGKEEFVKDSAQNAIKRDGTVRIKERPKTEIDISSFIISINTRVSSLPSHKANGYDSEEDNEEESDDISLSVSGQDESKSAASASNTYHQPHIGETLPIPPESVGSVALFEHEDLNNNPESQNSNSNSSDLNCEVSISAKELKLQLLPSIDPAMMSQEDASGDSQLVPPRVSRSASPSPALINSQSLPAATSTLPKNPQLRNILTSSSNSNLGRSPVSVASTGKAQTTLFGALQTSNTSNKRAPAQPMGRTVSGKIITPSRHKQALSSSQQQKKSGRASVEVSSAEPSQNSQPPEEDSQFTQPLDNIYDDRDGGPSSDSEEAQPDPQELLAQKRKEEEDALEQEARKRERHEKKAEKERRALEREMETLSEHPRDRRKYKGRQAKSKSEISPETTSFSQDMFFASASQPFGVESDSEEGEEAEAQRQKMLEERVARDEFLNSQSSQVDESSQIGSMLLRKSNSRMGPVHEDSSSMFSSETDTTFRRQNAEAAKLKRSNANNKVATSSFVFTNTSRDGTSENSQPLLAAPQQTAAKTTGKSGRQSKRAASAKQASSKPSFFNQLTSGGR